MRSTQLSLLLNIFNEDDTSQNPKQMNSKGIGKIAHRYDVSFLLTKLCQGLLYLSSLL